MAREAPLFHPALLLAILVYDYATGMFSSRKLENATYDSVAFWFVAADEHPDHDTLNGSALIKPDAYAMMLA